MLNGRRLLNLAALLFLAIFVFGLVRLLLLRYSTGDVFPAYSSLRTDPLGTKIFYESLRALPAYHLRRNERPLDRLGPGEGTTLFFLGTRDLVLSEKNWSGLDQFIRSGGRLVLSFYPRYRALAVHSPSPTPSPSPNAAEEETEKLLTLQEIMARWELKAATERKQEDELAEKRVPLPLAEKLRWNSDLSFQPQSDAWQTIYASQGGPVMIERAWGAGSIVLSSDSYFFSNEALLAARAPSLLAWLVAPSQRIIFDEWHLNVREQPGVATLLRRYGLGGFLLGFIALVLLWLWRNSVSALAPRRAAGKAHEIVAGRDSFGGFVHLLRRGIAPRQLLEVCLGEWKKTARDQQAILGALPITDDPVARYNEIAELLRTKKWKPISGT